MNKLQPYFDTNNAWVKLGNRLNAEGLLEDVSSEKKERTIIPYLKIAASIVVLLATAAMVLLFSTKDQPQEVMVENLVPHQTLVRILTDGTVVYLAGNSSIAFSEEFNTTNRKVKLVGEAFFQVSANKTLPFIVEVENSSIEVLGTSFVLRNVIGQDVELFVEYGMVGFSPFNDAQKSVVVERGYRLVFDGNEIVKSFSGYDNKWRNKNLHFSNEQLANIIAVINKNFAINVIIEDKSLAKRHLTVTFYDNTVDEMLSIICEYYNLKAKSIDDDTIVLTKKK